MVRLDVSVSGPVPVAHRVERFPCVIGRDAGCDVRAEAPGVWERHAEVTLSAESGFYIRAMSAGSLTLNGQPVQEARVRNGDRVNLGGAVLRFWLAPVRARSNRVGDVVFWSIFAGMLAAMVGLIFGQPR